MKKTNLLKNLFVSLIVFLGAGLNLNAQIIEVKSISCFGKSDGQLTVLMSTGTAPYTYLWNNGGTTNKIQALSAGVYSVTVTDALLVNTNFTYTLNNPPILSNVINTTPNSTWPSNNGAIAVTTTGGSGGNSYVLIDSLAQKTIAQVGPNFTGLASGKYFLTTSDINGCTVKNNVTVTETASYPVVAPAVPIHTIDTTACYYDMATASVKPDTLPASVYPIQIYFDDVLYKTIYGFRRDSTKMHYGAGVGTNQPMLGLGKLPSSPHFITGYTTVITGPNIGKDSATSVVASIANNFAPGFHTLKVVTANNKGYRYSWHVQAAQSPISICVASIVHNTVNGGSSGSFTCTAEGSYENFTYRITGPAGFTPVTTSSVNNLKAGVYTFTATDAYTLTSTNGYINTGCVRTEKITIDEPDYNLSAKNANATKFKVSSLNGKITLSNAPIGELVSIYNLQGIAIYNQQADTETITVSLPAHGMYVVRVSGESVKVVN